MSEVRDHVIDFGGSHGDVPVLTYLVKGFTRTLFTLRQGVIYSDGAWFNRANSVVVKCQTPYQFRSIPEHAPYSLVSAHGIDF